MPLSRTQTDLQQFKAFKMTLKCDYWNYVKSSTLHQKSLQNLKTQVSIYGPHANLTVNKLLTLTFSES